MIFNKDRWPVLDALDTGKRFLELAGTGKIHNPLSFDAEITGFQSFLEQFTGMRNCAHLYATEKIVQMVDHDPKIYPVLERESQKTNFWPEFHGTISYVVKDGNMTVPTTLLLDTLPPEVADGRHMFMLSAFMNNVFLGFIAGEDLGDKLSLMLTLPEKPDQLWLQSLNNSYSFCKQFLFFLDHCDERTNYILTDKNRRVKTRSGEKFVNPAGLKNLKIIDSSYFTTTIRTGEFPVAGHWRMQAYGQSRAKRKLVWIKDFVKHGYTRKSQISQSNKNNLDEVN